MEMKSETPELVEGQVLLDRYTILDEIGSGGMATIYRAHDERLDRIVCVKLLKEDLSPTGSTEGRREYSATYAHFLKEALALSTLQHPNTLRIYDFGYVEGSTRPFHVSEFLDGGNLEQHVRQHGALDVEEILAIVEAVTGALTEAHDKSIVHRDVKPSNILFGRIGGALIPKLADFGIAHSNLKPKHASEDSGEHVSTVTLFSPRWAAPEQIAGSSVGPATDVYALALVVAFMLAGVPVFDGKGVRATFAERIIGDRLVQRRLQEMGVPQEAHAVLLRALAANPNQRTPAVRPFFEQLRQALRSGPASASQARDARRDSMLSLSVEQELVAGEVHESAVHVPEHEDLVAGARAVQLVDLDPIDLAIPTGHGVDVRFRATLLLDRDGVRLNVKGLNCFVARVSADGARGNPTPALVTKEAGAAAFISSTREQLGHVSWSFGVRRPEGTRLAVEGGEIVVSYTRASYAVALDVGVPHPVVIVCKR